MTVALGYLTIVVGILVGLTIKDIISSFKSFKFASRIITRAEDNNGIKEEEADEARKFYLNNLIKQSLFNLIMLSSEAVLIFYLTKYF